MIPKNSDMRFEVTLKCNYNCVICPRDKITRRIETMSFELFKKLFDKINKETDQFDTLTFPGMGEPFLDKTLDRKIEYAKKQKNEISILILTNGSLLTPRRFKRLEKLGVTSVRVSLYGNDSSSYMNIHGIENCSLFNKIRDNLVKISQIRTSTELILTFNLVDKGNGADVKRWIRFWNKKADLVEVWKPHNWVNTMKYRNVQADKLKTCGRPFRGPLQVQVDGTVNMCCFDFNGKLTIGDLKRQSLNEIFSSALYKKIVKCHKTGNFKRSNLICESCDQRNKKRDDIMLYNSRFNIRERVKQISTTYAKIF